MVDGPKNMAASVKARLLNMAREEGRAATFGREGPAGQLPQACRCLVSGS